MKSYSVFLNRYKVVFLCGILYIIPKTYIGKREKFSQVIIKFCYYIMYMDKIPLSDIYIIFFSYNILSPMGYLLENTLGVHLIESKSYNKADIFFI